MVGPETVIPVLVSELDDRYWQALLDRFRAPGRAAILGVPMGDPEHGYTNSALGISAQASALPHGFYRYDKHHLVPFGEFVPMGFRWFTGMMNIPLGDFKRGPVAAPSFEVGGERIAPNICYEDLFGEELAARFVPETAAPTILANISNIGWFGRTIAIEQHLRISRMRSLELQRPMIRATNTGATVVIDHRGVVTHALAPFSVGILEGSVEGRQGLTPFASWAGQLGLWPPGAARGRSSLLVFRSSRRPLKSSRSALRLLRRTSSTTRTRRRCSRSSKSSCACSRTGPSAAARCCSRTTWRSAPARATPRPSCARSGPSRGRRPTCSRAGGRRTAATARTRTGCSTTTSTRSC